MPPQSTQTPDKSISIIEAAVKKFNDFKAIIKTQADYLDAGEALKRIKETVQKVEDFFGEDIQKAYDLHRSLTGKRKALLEPLNRAETAIKNARIAFSNEQDRLRKIEQDKLDEAARKREADEKAKLDKKIALAVTKGDAAKVESLQEQREQVMVHAPQASPRVEATEGVSQSKKWKGEVTDLKALVKAIASGLAPIALVEIKQSELDALAKLCQNNQKVDGIKFYEKVTEKVRV